MAKEDLKKVNQQSSTTAKPAAVKKAAKEKKVKEPAELTVSKKVKSAAPKKAASKKAVKEKSAEQYIEIHFLIRFHTEYGQTLSIVGNHALFGDNQPEKGLQLSYLNNEYWQGQISIPQNEIPAEPITYNYVLTDKDGSYVYDWGSDKQLDFSGFTKNKISIYDSWNHAGYFENVFYTEPFKNVLLAPEYTSLKASSASKTTTHTFRVKAPLLKKGEVLCIAGADKQLTAWNTEAPLFMTRKKDQNYWELSVNLNNARFPLEYKYGVYNIEEKRFVQYESGNNRLLYQQPDKDRFTIVNDGFAILPNNTWKGAGVAIPVFSLRTANGLGVGEFPDMKLLVDWAKKTGLKLIQILPVNDTIATHTWLDSYPYSAISAFALNPLYLNLDTLVDQKLTALRQELEEAKQRLNALPEIDFDSVTKIKWEFLRRLYPIKKTTVFKTKAYKEFFIKNEHWLVPYAVFCYLRDLNGTVDFNQWPQYNVYSETIAETLRKDDKAADEIAFHFFIQYQLHLQLKEATAYAHENGIIVKGDIPIGIYRYSCDAWQEPELYHMNMQAGAPPDDFAVKGQNWGFPTYNWKKMREDGFSWWRKRFEQMSHYFDAFRIDHILGFFRIWSIPMDAVEGILGYFYPAIPVHISEFNQRNIYFDKQRYCKPFINEDVLWKVFNTENEYVKQTFLQYDGFGMYRLKPEFDTQKKVETYFATLEQNEHNNWLKIGLFDLITDVILFEEEGSDGQRFHFRFAIESTESFKNLDANTQWALKQLYVNYFFERQDHFWKEEALLKLPELKRATNMLICGEDLGLVPSTVPMVMKDLGILSLEIQRMPKDPKKVFFHPADAPYLSVVTPSTHDMSTIRGWWEEDYQRTQQFYNAELGQNGSAPSVCEPWINKAIIYQHLYSPAMWSIFQIQDLLGMNEQLRRENPNEERINVPANPKHYWRYRMHIPLEQLLNESTFNEELLNAIKAAGR